MLVSPDLVDNQDVYRNDEDGSILFLYVTVKGGGRYTLADVKSDLCRRDDFEAVVNVVFQEGTSEGPVAGYFGFGLNDVNATIEIRGASVRLPRQKSFKIRLNRRMSPWNELWTVNLNKHPTDLTRVRNKLSFDYMEIIPHITSLRTQFINLFIKDLSGDVPAVDFVDYGLFTLVEQPNRLFLRSRGLCVDGHLYKAEFFEFHRFPDKLKNSNDLNYDRDVFERFLDIRGRDDHSKLLSMLDDVNDYNLCINKVIERHFNRKNYLTWLAVNILFDSVDTLSQDFFLYSPSDCNTWFFLPWDYDGAWGFQEQLGRARSAYLAPWQRGISNYWGVVLHRRFFQDPDNVQALVDKMELLLDTIITVERTTSFLNSYHPLVSQFVNSLPDSSRLRVEDFETEFWRIVNKPEKNFVEFIKAMENPMPIFLGIPYDREGKLVFRWSESFDLQNDAIFYDFQISDSPRFANIVIEHIGLVGTEISINPLPAGNYFWRVVVRDDQGNQQTAFDIYQDEDNLRFFGVRTFIVD